MKNFAYRQKAPLIKKGKKGEKRRKSSELQPPDLIPGTCGIHNHDDRLFFLTQAISAENFDFNFRFQVNRLPSSGYTGYLCLPHAKQSHRVHLEEVLYLGHDITGLLHLHLQGNGKHCLTMSQLSVNGGIYRQKSVAKEAANRVTSTLGMNFRIP